MTQDIWGCGTHVFERGDFAIKVRWAEELVVDSGCDMSELFEVVGDGEEEVE